MSMQTNFVPPYPVTPPATPTPSQSSYFQQPQHPSISVTSPTSPPPRPPKLPAGGSHATGQPAPPLPARNPQQHQDPSRNGRQGDSNSYTPHSSSLPQLTQLGAVSIEELRRKSDEQYQRRPSHPPSSYTSSSNNNIPIHPNNSSNNNNNDIPPPPPPKESTNSRPQSSQNQQDPTKSSQISLTNPEEKRRKRRESKSQKEKGVSPHPSEMERLRRQKNSTRSRLRILSLDGGGIRGYSTLLLLEALMHDIFVEIHGRAPRRGEELTKPCEVFDLIGGTGTGGLIAIMLGRLRMSVQTCKEVYVRMTRYVFETDKRFAGVPYGDTLYKASKLERAIRTVVQERTREDHLDLNMEMNSEDEDWDLEPSGGIYDDEEKEMERRMSLMGRTDSIKAIAEASRIAGGNDGTRPGRGNSEALMHDKRKGRCKTLVTAVYKGSTDSSTPAVFRTYSSGVESMSYPDCRIWQAGRATCATLAAFKPIRINQDVFLDEGTGRYNPTPTILEEACVTEWPGREIGLVVSLGTGKRPQSTQKGDNKVQWWENLGTSLDQFTQARRRLMTKIDFCETTHLHVLNDELQKYGISKNRYFRFNVDVGVGEVAMNEWMRLSEVSTSTRVYLAGPVVGDQMKDVARRMGKLTRDKWRKKVQGQGGVIATDEKGEFVVPVPQTMTTLEGVKMEATVKEPVPTVYYEMPGDLPALSPVAETPNQQSHPDAVELGAETGPDRGQERRRRRDERREGVVQQAQQNGNIQPPKPNVPAIRITPPSVRHPGGRPTDVELPG